MLLSYLELGESFEPVPLLLAIQIEYFELPVSVVKRNSITPRLLQE